MASRVEFGYIRRAQCRGSIVELFCQAVDKLGELIAPKHACLLEELLCLGRHEEIVAQGRLFAAGFRRPTSDRWPRPHTEPGCQGWAAGSSDLAKAQKVYKKMEFKILAPVTMRR